MYRYLSIAILAVSIAATVSISGAASMRSVDVRNRSGATIDVGFLNTSSPNTLLKYGAIHDGRNLAFDLPDQETTIVVKSTVCASKRTVLPRLREIVATIEPGCAVKT